MFANGECKPGFKALDPLSKPQKYCRLKGDKGIWESEIINPCQRKSFIFYIILYFIYYIYIFILK